MKALVLGDELAVQEIAPPEAKAGEAVIGVRVAGICATDLEIVRGYMGFRGVLGHEMVGVVETAPDPVWQGRRVAGEINLACGACPACRRGHGRHCPERRVLGILGKDGCFAETVTLPMANLHPIPDGIPDQSAVFIEPLAAAFEILEQIHLQPDDRVLVLGDGKLGLLCAMVLAQTGCALVVVGRHARKLAIAEDLGARTFPADGFDAAETGFDVVVEATGSPRGLALALERVRPRGTLVLKSTFHAVSEVETAKIVIDEIQLIGSRCGPFAPAIRALAAGHVDPRPLLDATYPLAQGPAAFAHASRPGTLKVALEIGR